MNRDKVICSILTLGLLVLVALLGACLDKNASLSLQNESLIEQVSDYQELIDVVESNRKDK